MHVIKGMVGCLGDMDMVMIKLHEDSNTGKKNKNKSVIIMEEAGCGDVG